MPLNMYHSIMQVNKHSLLQIVSLKPSLVDVQEFVKKPYRWGKSVKITASKSI